jgi:deoxyribonuclease-1
MPPNWKIPSQHELKQAYQLYQGLIQQGRWTEIQWRLSRYRYAAFTLIALITLTLPWCTYQRTPTPTIPSSVILPTAAMIVATRASALNRTEITRFSVAKSKLLQLYADANITQTFYCDCNYRGKRIDLKSCGVTANHHQKRANRIEWEHLAAISWLGQTLPCWKQGGRKHCGKVDKFYQRAEADLHNLVPAIGAINATRSNYPFVPSIIGEKREWGRCDIEIENHRVELPKHRQGDVARAVLYMHDIYGMPLKPDEITRYQHWHQTDPPTIIEKQLHDLKAKVQGNRNPYYEN